MPPHLVQGATEGCKPEEMLLDRRVYHSGSRVKSNFENNNIDRRKSNWEVAWESRKEVIRAYKVR